MQTCCPFPKKLVGRGLPNSPKRPKQEPCRTAGICASQSFIRNYRLGQRLHIEGPPVAGVRFGTFVTSRSRGASNRRWRTERVLKERNIMKAFIWKSLAVAGMAIGAASSVALAQGAEYSPMAPRAIVVTAGQGGAMSLPT